MKLRYVKNLAYYDGPLTDLFVDEDSIDTYISFPLHLGQEDGPDWKFVFLARKVDETCKSDHTWWPNDYFDTTNQDAELFFFDFNDAVETKEWNDKFPYYIVDARPITPEERVQYAPDTCP